METYHQGHRRALLDVFAPVLCLLGIAGEQVQTHTGRELVPMAVGYGEHEMATAPQYLYGYQLQERFSLQRGVVVFAMPVCVPCAVWLASPVKASIWARGLDGWHGIWMCLWTAGEPAVVYRAGLGSDAAGIPRLQGIQHVQRAYKHLRGVNCHRGVSPYYTPFT